MKERIIRTTCSYCGEKKEEKEGQFDPLSVIKAPMGKLHLSDSSVTFSSDICEVCAEKVRVFLAAIEWVES